MELKIGGLKDLLKKNEAPEKQEKPAAQDKMRKCKKCGAEVSAIDVKKNWYACPECGGYFRIHAYRRIKLLSDKESFEEWDKELPFSNPLDFPEYEEKVAETQEATGLNEAIVTGRMKIDGIPCAIGVCDARYMMSSMGHNMGEKIARMAERATEEKLPLILYACSGGARMQEGIVSLMQMVKTSEAIGRLQASGQLFVSVLTDPTMGGVTASFAMLGDIILAEPNATVGFTGQRVIQQTIGGKLPDGFQKSEFLMQHGFVDAIVERKDQREVLAHILKLHSEDAGKTEGLTGFGRGGMEMVRAAAYAGKNITGKVLSTIRIARTQGFLRNRGEKESGEVRTAWETVKLSRVKERARAEEYIYTVFPDFFELHGDRRFADDGAVIGGLASFNGIPVTVIGIQKGRDFKENAVRNFGMPNPEGYRKALRLMKQAEKFKRPVICFVDTPGAFCGIGAEERGQGLAIAENLQTLAALETPILSIIIGEGSSGGALALATANEVWMMENAVYSILSPEGFAAILYRDGKQGPRAAEEMKLTSQDLLKLGIIERIIPEEEPASKDNMEAVREELDPAIAEFIEKYSAMSGAELSNQRYERYRRF